MQIGKHIRNIFFADKKEEVPDVNMTPSVYSESQLYTGGFTRYNPDDLIGRKGFGIYKKMMNDEQVKAVVRFRRASVTGRDWYFEAPEGLSETEAEKRIKIFNEIVSLMPGKFKDSLNGIMSSMYNGFSQSEKVHQHVEIDGKTWIGLKSLRAKPFDTFYFDVDEYGDLVNVEQHIDGKIVKINPSDMIHHVQNSDEDFYYGKSELREAYRSYWSKDTIIKLHNIHLERHSSGFISVTPPKGTTLKAGTPEHNKLQNMINNVTTSTGFLWPAGFTGTLEKPNNTDAFEKAIEMHNKGIAKALLMPGLLGVSEQGDVGSYGQSQTQLEAFLWVLDDEADSLEETLNEQLFKKLGQINFGDDLYPKFRFNDLSESKKAAIASVWADMISKGAAERTDADEAYLRELLGIPEKEESEDEDTEDDTDNGSGDGDTDDDSRDDDDNRSDSPDSNEDVADEMLSARRTLSASFSKAQRRVDFNSIDRSSEVLIWQGADMLSSNIEELIGYATDQVELGKTEIKVPKSVEKALNKNMQSILSRSWDIGMQNGKRELEKSGMQRMSKIQFHKFTALGDMAMDYFQTRSAQTASKLSQDVVSTINNVIANGIKYTHSTQQMVDNIYEQLASQGLISGSTAEAAGVALDIANPDARLNTTVRTASFDAINEARFDYFTSPDLGGYVTSLEYSAILDSRTTEICSSLDGDVYPVGAAEWDKFRPPNHFNCRSLLIPVTVQDDIQNTIGTPEVEPSKGFFNKERDHA